MKNVAYLIKYSSMLTQYKLISTSSARFHMVPIKKEHADLVLNLFNTKGWLEFIGDRNIHSLKDAEVFIQNAENNPNACLWIISLNDNLAKHIGLVTLIKRDYLNYPDIGYALMPNFMGKGIAFEAVKSILNAIIETNEFNQLFAITLPQNFSSLKLLDRLQFKFEKEIIDKNEMLHLYKLDIAIIE